ncbi:MAG: 4-alpha-glucanotransferase [Gammaproteobacteria bacterium]|nr:4-alpha-glucanotransferase [Gammaproteobacteria bacterium]
MPSLDLKQRRAGVLLHPTSLPSGKLDSDVDHWMQTLVDTGFTVWQVLPLCEPQIGLSPYTCSSTFAINPVLLSEFPDIDENDAGFIAFCGKQQFWLDDYVLFKILKQHFNGAAWVLWPALWKQRDPETMQLTMQEYKHEITELKWQQYQLYKRWQEIRHRANAMGLLLFGDLPIFIGHDSADVWSHPELFLLDSDGYMEVVTGVPPDYFSETGQRWGNPHYNWNSMQEEDYAWWKARIRHHLEQFDLLRIDHFRGLEAAWVIDAACETAVNGQWQKMPGDELLSSLQEEGLPLPFIAEDLGIITPEVTALRKKYHLPGMSILQFGFDEFEDNPHKPQNIEEDAVVYTGTHDNDTTKGWFNSLDDHVKNYVLEALSLPYLDDPYYESIEVADMVIETMVENALQSPARICIVPLQDYLHLDSSTRMNTPGTITGNWAWRFQWHELESHHENNHMEKMRQRIENANRLVKEND